MYVLYHVSTIACKINYTRYTQHEFYPHVNAFSSYHDDVIKWKHFRVTGPLWGEFTGQSSQMPVTWSFDVFYDLRLNKQLGKQSSRKWFETQSHTSWRHCNTNRMRSFLVCNRNCNPWAIVSHPLLWMLWNDDAVACPFYAYIVYPCWCIYRVSLWIFVTVYDNKSIFIDIHCQC